MREVGRGKGRKSCKEPERMGKRKGGGKGRDELLGAKEREGGEKKRRSIKGGTR